MIEIYSRYCFFGGSNLHEKVLPEDSIARSKVGELSISYMERLLVVSSGLVEGGACVESGEWEEHTKVER